MIHPRVNQGTELEGTSHRNQRNLSSKMDQVHDESALIRDWQITSDGFVHPCVSDTLTVGLRTPPYLISSVLGRRPEEPFERSPQDPLGMR